MRHQTFGPRRILEHWNCLKCGRESSSEILTQCKNGQKINETIKLALSAICCSKQIIDLIINPSLETEPTPKPKTEVGKRFAITEDLLDQLSKKPAEEFLPKSEIRATMELQGIAGALKLPVKLKDQHVISLYKIFEPLLKNTEITKFHTSTRICEDCIREMRRENYDGTKNIPKVHCPICDGIIE